MNKQEIAERDRRQDAIWAWRRSNDLDKADGVYLRAEYGGREFIRHVPYPMDDERPYGWHVSDAYYFLQSAFNTKHTDKIQWASQTAIGGDFGDQVQYHVMVLCCGNGGAFNPRTQLYVRMF
jgi:hypothetical protein